MVSKRWPWRRATFREANRVSLDALSQQLPLRLIEAVMPHFRSRPLNSWLAYWLPRSPWKIWPALSLGLRRHQALSSAPLSTARPAPPAACRPACPALTVRDRCAASRKLRDWLHTRHEYAPAETPRSGDDAEQFAGDEQGGRGSQPHLPPASGTARGSATEADCVESTRTSLLPLGKVRHSFSQDVALHRDPRQLGP